MHVLQWMNRDLVTVSPDESFRTAMHLIRQKGIRHIPVVEGKRLVGIITDRDLRQASPSGATSLSIHELHYILERLTVREVMTKQVVTIRPEQTVEEAALLLLGHRIGGLPVVREGELCGIITETDILQAFLQLRGKGPLDVASSIVEIEREKRAQ
ncbi:MAG: CBS domain-containing protein [candidate division NC10 bacterium]|nr:CBS domain-containing protein [candidate division NC10 bacterium]MBI2458752.1 CBS domain-containing protein [candidate division NC10 bacterium]MBI2562270.1 CBS domain-containing protein [candidate division NC10 bacterium]MBI3086543.1 CBS domain-containing protein [candidate division NC10 bacterium]